MAEVLIDFIGGNCPVQAEGTIDGKRFYFRARGDSWSLEVHPTSGGGYLEWPDDPEVWRYEEDYGVWPDAGWMEESEARGFIDKAAALYENRNA